MNVCAPASLGFRGLPWPKRICRRLALGLALAMTPLGRAADAVAFDIPAGTAESALKAFSVQSGQQVLAPADLLVDVRTAEVHGTFTPLAALERMLDTTTLAAVESNGAFAIVLRAAQATRPARVLNAAAVIAIGLATDEAQARRFETLADTIRDALARRGLPVASIAVVPKSAGERVRRETLLAALQSVKPGVDETWLVLIGQIAAGREGRMMFQVSGPRWSADDFAAAVKALPGKKQVVLATTGAGAFLPPLLACDDVEAVAATTGSGEVSEPRFPMLWAAALRARPGAPFRALAVDAARQVQAFYREHHLGETEHAQLIDRARGEILTAPFSAEIPAPGVPPP